jgi:hypothetical protein
MCLGCFPLKPCLVVGSRLNQVIRGLERLSEEAMSTTTEMTKMRGASRQHCQIVGVGCSAVEDWQEQRATSGEAQEVCDRREVWDRHYGASSVKTRVSRLPPETLRPTGSTFSNSLSKSIAQYRENWTLSWWFPEGHVLSMVSLVFMLSGPM